MDASIASVIDDLLEDQWFQLTFLLVVSLFASFLFARFGQPKVIGYIIVGVIIGGSVLGIIESPLESGTGDGTDGQLTTPTWALAKLGSIILMFMIGLECELKEIYSRRSILIGVGGVLLPWVVGYYSAQLAGYTDPEAVFIGAALVATSVAITASVMSELGMIGTPVAYAILGAAVIDDILGMIVLAISGGIAAQNVDYVEILLLGIASVAFIAIAAIVGTRYITKLVFKVQVSGYRRKLPMSGFVLALSFAFLFAFISGAIGISAIIGAFVAGTIFSGSALRDGLLKGSMYLEALFVPLFFVSLGTEVNVKEIWGAIGFAIALIVVAMVTKIVGCGLPARATGMSFWDSLAVGMGMTPRLEIALVIAYYGLTAGIIGPDLYSVVVFMGLVTAIFAPLFVRRIMARGGHPVESTA